MSAIEDIRRHMDAEFSWIVSETVSNMFSNAESVKRFVICQGVGRAVGETLIERLGADKVQTAGLTVGEFEKAADKSLNAMPESVKAKGAQSIATYAAEACLVYAQSRLMGMDSPYNPVPRRPHDDYWPFGQEGGFCNPMKLQLLHDGD
jgi:hypothetical protein